MVYFSTFNTLDGELFDYGREDSLSFQKKFDSLFIL